ncbi:hypothetical protein O1611_g824 [Lasiodiplodia mahajangana]|uniref:Uncharacterized protein n=1 Tax=Lasiodiplodia mahajangana TaxID=1108764 RepID=A0ACC2JZ52_9PEZI|nr:hypothetical protein O1611_g824 [Lasiodiplodia mahajangana]
MAQQLGSDSIFRYVHDGDINNVGICLDSGTDINQKHESWDQTPAAMAVGFNQVKVLELLIERNADINIPDRGGRTPLFYAVLFDRSEAIQRLLQAKADPNFLDKNGKSPLHWAAKQGNTEAVELLVKYGTDVNRPDDDGQTPLMFAAMNNHYDTIAILLDAEAAIDTRDSINEQSAVSFAAENGHTKVVELLIKAGCNIYSQGERYPPLERAASRGNPELLRLFLGPEPQDSELLVQAKAIAETLYHACSHDYSEGYEDTKEFILGRERDYFSCKDKDGRTALSWAAQIASKETVDALLTRGADPNSVDNNGRAPLSWAAENGNGEIVQALLFKGANPDRADDNNRTPLSWAAENGGMTVVRSLLPENKTNETLEYVTKRGQADPKSVDLAAMDTKWTPLWYAAMGGHVKATKALLESGANPLTKDNQGKEMINYLATDKRIDHKEVWRVLEPYFELLSECKDTTKEVDELFWAMVLKFPENPDEELGLKQVTVRELLTSSVHTALSTGTCLKWVHLPANNMRWVEILMTKHYKGCGEKGNQSRNKILKSKLWTENQNIPQHETTPQRKDHYHGRFMRPGCHVLPPEKGSTPSQARSGTSRNAEDSCLKGFVLFMPYLHWERERAVIKLKKIQEKRGGERSENGELNETETLYRTYLGEKHPLHIRRTLDRYYYPNSSNIDDRDGDQTSLRYFETHGFNCEEFERVLTMVDQLWMWVLPARGEMPATIITAFPQRSDRKAPEKLTALVANIHEKCRDLSTWSCYEVAEVIVAECSRVYFDFTSNRKQLVQFLTVYRASIGKIIDNDAERFSSLQQTIGKLNYIFGQAKTKTLENQPSSKQSEAPQTTLDKRGEQDKADKAKKPLDREEVLCELLDIEADIEDLRQIKDIRDELTIMENLFRRQEGVIQEMSQIMQVGEGQNKNKSHEKLYSPHTVVERNLKEVELLDRFAKRAEEAIEQLLGLKEKQADLLLTNTIYKINDATDKQGKTLMTFTVVTIIFFPWIEDKLPLNWVVKILLSVALPLSVVLLIIAFSFDKSLRETRVKSFITRWISCMRPSVESEGKPQMRVAVKGRAAYGQAAPKSAGLWRRNCNLQEDIEGGTNVTSAARNSV